MENASKDGVLGLHSAFLCSALSAVARCCIENRVCPWSNWELSRELEGRAAGDARTDSQLRSKWEQQACCLHLRELRVLRCVVCLEGREVVGKLAYY